MIAALKVACQEKRKRLAMKKELSELKEEFGKLKGMVCLAVASLNLQNNGFPTEDVQDVRELERGGDYPVRPRGNPRPQGVLQSIIFYL